MTFAAEKIDAEAHLADADGLESRAAALVNPASGLANDYLNVFNELVMLVEHLPMMPDLIKDVLAWRPISYEDYFRKSSLPGKKAALENFERLPSDLRREFEEVVAELDLCATGTVAAIRLQLRRRADDVEGLSSLCAKGASAMHGILKRATGIVNTGVPTPAELAELAQSRADRLMAVREHAQRDVQNR